MLDVTFLNKIYTKPKLPRLKYWERNSQIFYWLHKLPIKRFRKTYPHDVFHDYCLDDEELINTLAKKYGWKIAQEDINLSSSVYTFKKM